jgi:5-methyltetrahydropteroyltriglutamate--homocysteine methyltransferase
MIKSCDTGSLTFVGKVEKFLEGATRFNLYPASDSVKFFEKRVIEGFLDKIDAGLDVPNYPQFRDMNEMFLVMMDGVERVKGGYLETKIPSIKPDRNHIPEVMVIKKNSQMIYERKKETFETKVCVTGPYTLSSLFLHRDNEIFSRLGKIISQIVENNVFSEKHNKVSLVAVDEPVFGLQDDPLIDFGSEGRENLRKAWESIFHKAKSKNAQTLLHLHNTADDPFWEIKSLNVIDSHVDDPIYQTKKTKERLESTDKFLKASISIADFDTLIKNRIITTSRKKMTELAINERVAEVWTGITSRKTSPEAFLEKHDIMKKRLAETVDRFGVERVPYAGPECGLKGFPNYDCALECLRRVSNAVKTYLKNVKV